MLPESRLNRIGFKMERVGRSGCLGKKKRFLTSNKTKSSLYRRNTYRLYTPVPLISISP
jgi:hypothetical protein